MRKIIKNVADTFAYYRYRWNDRKNWWVCVFWLNDGAERGSFACFGNTKEEAMTYALKYIQDTSITNGDGGYIVRRPNLFEVLFG